MAHLAPSISFVQTLQRHIQQGRSVNHAFDLTVREEETEFSLRMELWRAREGEGELRQWARTHYQLSLLEILRQGFAGAPVLELLEELEIEMQQEFERQWKAHLERLPLLLSLPMLFCFFPAYVVLLFGPLVLKFLQEVNG